MKTKTFSFNLPQELIAQYPTDKRDACRLLSLEKHSGKVAHHHMMDFPNLLQPDSLLVLNDTKVRKARLYAATIHGGTVEFLLLHTEDNITWDVVCSKSSRQKVGRRYTFAENLEAEIIAETEEGKRLTFSRPVTDQYLEKHGHIPLPPYIRREDTSADAELYQTVYSRKIGSAAAPTAGLHFTEELLERIGSIGVTIAYVTLHVGIGTFQPIRTKNIEEHTMHREHYEVPARTAQLVSQAKREGRPVVAVGTTSVRTLESAWSGNRLPEGQGSTDIYIMPGFQFNVVDGLVTNFHTPESTLLVMVSAFVGLEKIKTAYEIAVDERYRFFSYGDTMFIH